MDLLGIYSAFAIFTWNMYTIRRVVLHKRLPVSLLLCVVGAWFWLLPVLVAGLFGLLTLTVVFSGFIGINFLSILLCDNYFRRKKHLLLVRETVVTGSTDKVQTRSIHLLSVLGMLVLLPSAYVFTKHLYVISTAVTEPNSIIFCWDTLIYHYPALVEFYQQETLWTFRNPFQSYYYGYELIGFLTSVLSKQTWSLLVLNQYAVFFLIVSIIVLANRIYIFSDENKIHFGKNIFTFCILSAFFICFQSKINAFGKNDIFQTATLLGTLAFLLEFFKKLSPIRLSSSKIILLLGSAASFSLSLLTKPTSIAYLPYFNCLILYALFFSVKSQLKNTVKIFCLFNLIVFSLGGIFVYRNLIQFHALNDSYWNAAFDRSIVFNVLNTKIFYPQIETILFLLCVVFMFLAIFINMLKSKNFWSRFETYAPISFCFCTFLVFIMTPYTLHGTSVENSKWQIRLGMPFFISSFWFLSFFYIEILTFLKKFISYRIRILNVTAFKYRVTQSIRNFIVMSLIILLVIAPVIHRVLPNNKLNGYEVEEQMDKKVNKKSIQIYQYFNDLNAESKIYAINAPPAIFYGKNWQHKVFFDHDKLLETEDSCRLKRILNEFKPNFIVLSVDFTRQKSANERVQALLKTYQPSNAKITLQASDSLYQLYKVVYSNKKVDDKMGRCCGTKSPLQMYKRTCR